METCSMSLVKEPSLSETINGLFLALDMVTADMGGCRETSEWERVPLNHAFKTLLKAGLYSAPHKATPTNPTI